MAYDDEEIRRLLKEEQSRGKRPPPTEEIYKARIKKLKDFRKALESGNWDLFRKMLNGYGLKEGTKEWNDAEKIWNQYHGPRYR
jgi:hypothetical protein